MKSYCSIDGIAAEMVGPYCPIAGMPECQTFYCRIGGIAVEIPELVAGTRKCCRRNGRVKGIFDAEMVNSPKELLTMLLADLLLVWWLNCCLNFVIAAEMLPKCC